MKTLDYSAGKVKSDLDFSAYRTALTAADILKHFGHLTNGKRQIPCFVHGGRESGPSPSLTVYSHHVTCYGCEFRTDTIGLVGQFLHGNPKPKGDEFWKCIDWICSRTGLTPPKRDPEALKRYEAAKTVSDTYEHWFKASLKHEDKALAYLESRGIPSDAVRGHVGYLPWIGSNSFGPPAIEAGLGNDKGNFYFGKRLIIPVRHAGQIISLYGRDIDPNGEPNYRHRYPKETSENIGLPKTLYGLSDHAGKDRVYLTEGILDCLTYRLTDTRPLPLTGPRDSLKHALRHLRIRVSRKCVWHLTRNAMNRELRAHGRPEQRYSVQVSTYPS